MAGMAESWLLDMVRLGQQMLTIITSLICSPTIRLQTYLLASSCPSVRVSVCLS